MNFFIKVHMTQNFHELLVDELFKILLYAN